MTDPKDFLSRWSQRKLNPEAEKSAPEKPTSLPAAEKDAAAPSASEPEFDITSLPSLESIGANSDVRAFLQRGVPAGLARAALRRAWSADPAIRDFVGLTENSWDFNAPDSIPGFGSLDADEVRQVAARFFGGPAEDTGVQADPLEAEKCEENPAEAKPAAEPGPRREASEGLEDMPPTDVALQQEEPVDSPPQPRRHGGALPQ
jgi:hypothetical protein